ncbi:MAG: RNA polymerase sigma factor [Saprospiraceae bacterium]
MDEIKKLTDEELLTKYLENQSDAYFSALHRRYINKVYSKSISLLRNEAMAEDAVQEIFLKIFLNLSKFTFRSKFSTWVYSITYNYCIDLIRKQKKHKKLFTDNNENLPNPDPGEDALNEKILLEMKFDRLKEVLEIIPLDDKIVLVMKYKDGLGIRDISKIIGKSESAVKMKIKRAKAKAKKSYMKLFPNE